MNVSSNSELDHQRAITRAEILMCELIAELNLPLTAADTFNKAFKLMFPDSKIAEGFLFYHNFMFSMYRQEMCMIHVISMNLSHISLFLSLNPYFIGLGIKVGGIFS